MILAIGLMLWALILLSAATAARLTLDGALSTRARRWTAAILLAGAAILLLRPEEELFSGEDPGAYINSAMAFNRHGRLIYTDPALAELKPFEWTAFRYGHGGFFPSKDNCLLVRDGDKGIIGPWFQPAYSLILSLPAAFGLPYLAFFLTPLLAIGVGILVAGLAWRMTRDHALALAAFALFVLHPVIVWNARGFRAEIPATLLLLSGVALLTARLTGATPPRKSTGAIAGLAIGTAILFHITAVYVVIPAIFAGLVMSRLDDRFWQSWWCGLALPILVFVLQTMLLTDCYRIINLLQNPEQRRLIIAAGALFLTTALFMRRLLLARRAKSLPAHRERRFSSAPVIATVLTAGSIVAVMLVYRHRAEDGGLPGLPAWLPSYLGLTDFRGVAALSSRTASAIALAGLIGLSAARRSWGRWLLGLLGPATLAVGWVINFMFETRRLVMAMVPLMVLATVALMATAANLITRGMAHRFRLKAAPAQPQGDSARLAGFTRILFVSLATLALLLAGMRGRSLLYSLWSLKGTHAFYRDLGTQMLEHGDFVFAEYTQTATPVEHFTGFPLLAVAWEYRSEDEYRIAEEVIRRQVHDHPDRRHLFVSPFEQVTIPGLSTEFLFSETLETVSLGRARRAVPRHTVPRRTTMRVWRLHQPHDLPRGGEPFVRRPAGSRFGVAGLANRMPSRNLTIPARVCRPGESNPLKIQGNMPSTSADYTLYLVFATGNADTEHLPDIGLRGRNGEIDCRTFSLGPGWLATAIPDAALYSDALLDLNVSAPLYLVELLLLDHADGRTERLPNDGGQKHELTLTGIDLQWMKASSSVTLPRPGTGYTVWMLASNGRTDGIATTAILHDRHATTAAPTWQGIENWQWKVWRPPSGSADQPSTGWFDLHTDPAWNPKLEGYPSDLGLLVERFVVVPDPD